LSPRTNFETTLQLHEGTDARVEERKRNRSGLCSTSGW
jgi:hypothetical protein